MVVQTKMLRQKLKILNAKSRASMSRQQPFTVNADDFAVNYMIIELFYGVQQTFLNNFVLQK